MRGVVTLLAQHFSCPMWVFQVVSMLRDTNSYSCSDIMSSPRYVACGHSFCGPCILQWIVRQVSGGHYSSQCPMCRAELLSTYQSSEMEYVHHSAAFPLTPNYVVESFIAFSMERLTSLANKSEPREEDILNTAARWFMRHK
jgi:hypothetical protein